jgi:hypothetical protein
MDVVWEPVAHFRDTVSRRIIDRNAKRIGGVVNDFESGLER